MLPNTYWLDTMWSPALSSAIMIAPIAAMPVANVTVPTPPSIAVILASSAAEVGIALPAVGIAGRAALEDRRKLARVAVAVRDRQVQRLVQRAVLDRRVAIGVEDGGREAALVIVCS